MKKFVKKLTILIALVFAPLSLTCFNKPTFAMESNSNKQLHDKELETIKNSYQEKIESLVRKVVDSEKEIAELINSVNKNKDTKYKSTTEKEEDAAVIEAATKICEKYISINLECKTYISDLLLKLRDAISKKDDDLKKLFEIKITQFSVISIKASSNLRNLLRNAPEYISKQFDVIFLK